MFGFFKSMFKPTPPRLDVLCSRTGTVIVKRGNHVVQEIGPETTMAIFDAVSDSMKVNGGRRLDARPPAPQPLESQTKREPTLVAKKRAARKS
jgi:hypothetical protein